MPTNSFILANKSYQGIYAIYPNGLLPFKAKKCCELDPILKTYNREINKRRIVIKHVFFTLKTFNILTESYYNRRKRLGLRFNLIARIYNSELSKKLFMQEV
ncbi:transposase family protein [Acinetobacter bereziniae]|uniref:transposase family protein n=1 Tax=Acinetobacter bereziniae TaxID=106648 RepID=UPI0014891F4C|nr:transposase family protein [Acinetobacter bereziniae]